MRRYLERKVEIRWTDRDGKIHGTGRWLSQVRQFAANRRAEGHPGPYLWRLHSRAPWRSEEQANVQRSGGYYERLLDSAAIDDETED